MGRLKTRALFVYLLFMLLAGLLFPALGSSTEGRANDVWLETREKEWDLALQIDRLDGYAIASPDPGKMILDMGRIVAGSLFKERLRKWKDALSLMAGRRDNLQLLIRFPAMVREVECAWVEDQHLLFLRFFIKEKQGGKAPVTSAPCVLKGVRFGIRKTFVRTVMDLSSRPGWRLGPEGTDRLGLFLEGTTSTAAAPEPPSKGEVRRAQLKASGKGLMILLGFDNSKTAFRLFWLDKGGRLVVDAYHLPGPVLPEDMNLPSWFGKAKEPVSDPAPVSPEKKSLVREAMSNIFPLTAQEPLVAIPKGKQPRASKEVKAEPQIAPEREAGTGPKVTIRLPKPRQNPVPQKDDEKESAAAINPHAKPNSLRKEERKFEPGEAALYGSILQARDLRHENAAVELIDRFAAKHPGSDMLQESLFIKADILAARLQEGQKGTLNSVVQAYQDVINRFPGSDLALECYVRMAKVYAAQGNDYLGIGCLDLAIRRYQKAENLGSAYLERGQIYLKKNQPEKAVADFKTVLTRYPSSPWTPFALFGIAKYLQARGLYREAQKRLSRIETLLPDFFMENPDFLSVQAQNFLYLKEYAKARSYFYRAVNLPDQSEKSDLLLVHIGDTYLQQSQRKEAEKFYTFVKDTFPASEGASIASLRLGELHGDVKTFKEVKEKNPGASVAEIAALKEANAYYESGFYQKTMESLKELLVKPPKDPMVDAAKTLFSRATEKAMEDLYKQEKLSEVVALFNANKAVLKGRIAPETQLLVAESLARMKDYWAAVAAYRDLDPFDLSTGKERIYYLGLAECLWLSGLHGESIRFLEKAREKELPPKVKSAVTRALADRYKKEERYKEAYHLYDAMIQEKKLLDTKEMADAYLSMGEVLNAQGKYQEARAVLNRSIALSERTKALKPELFLSLGQLGVSYLKEGRYRDAMGAYAQAFGSEHDADTPGFWDIKLGQAEALLGLGKRAAAEEALNEVYEGRGPGPRYWDLRYRLGLAYVKNGSIQSGEKLLKEVSEEGTPALQSDAQMKLGSLNLTRQLEKLSIWPQIGGQEQQHVR